MKTPACVLPALALCAALSACAVSAPDQPAAVGLPAEPATAPAVPAPPVARTYQPGLGIVESASVVSLSSSSPAAAGGTASPATSPTMAYRLRMPDGTTQSVVQAGERFEVGDRVQISGEGRLMRP